MRVNQIRAVGIGELLARIDRLRKLLDAEGLFDPRLKRPIPFLPNTIGLITGRASAAEHDVMSVATDRWPAVRFAIRNTAVQGPNAVPQIVEALRELDADPDVDVIVSPAAAAASRTCCRSPTRRCAGRSPRAPRRWSARSATSPTTRCAIWSPTCGPPPRPTRPSGSFPTPPPSRRGCATCAGAAPARCATGCAASSTQLGQLRSRPVLAQPLAALTTRADEIHRARAAARRDITRLVGAETERVGHLSARLATLGPAATLARGYAVVQAVPARARRPCCTSVADAPAGTRLRVRVADGAITAVSEGSQMKPISQLGYEEARDELIEVVRQLEQGGLDLDASLKLWERGEELAKRCEEHLAGARKRVEDALAAGDEPTAGKLDSSNDFAPRASKLEHVSVMLSRHG